MFMSGDSIIGQPPLCLVALGGTKEFTKFVASSFDDFGRFKLYSICREVLLIRFCYMDYVLERRRMQGAIYGEDFNLDTLFRYSLNGNAEFDYLEYRGIDIEEIFCDVGSLELAITLRQKQYEKMFHSIICGKVQTYMIIALLKFAEIEFLELDNLLCSGYSEFDESEWWCRQANDLLHKDLLYIDKLIQQFSTDAELAT